MSPVTRRILSIAAAAVCALGATALADEIKVVDQPDASKPNQFYPGNRPPLVASRFINLPFGAVKPQGWLRKQLELEANGFTGHLTEISDFCKKENNAWLSPLGEGAASWEEVPYWFRGFSALGYVLDDQRIIQEAQPYLEAAIASQTDYGYFGPNPNLWAPVHPAVPTEMFTTPDGKPGLQAEYFKDQDFKQLQVKRVDPNINFTWAKDVSPMEGITPEHFSIRWTGRITVKETGDYVFSLFCDDGARLSLDGQVVVEDWSGHAPRTTTAKKPVHLEAGKAYDLKLDYFNDINGSEIRLGWKKPGATYEPRGMPDLMPNQNMIWSLRSYYEYTGDKRVIEMLKKYYKWELEVPDKWFYSGGWQFPRNGDDLDSVYWLYNITGEAYLLDVASKLQRCGKTWMNTDTGGHNVDFSQGFRKPALYWQQNQDPKFLQATEKNWDSIFGIYGQVPGGTFGGDEFARAGYTDPRQAIETCGAVEMIISEQKLFKVTGDPKWLDRAENAAFNTLPATMTPDMKALRYLTSPNQVNSDARSKAPELADGGPMQVMNPHDHRCCQHNSGAGWPYFAQSIWHATAGNGLSASTYAASKVKAKVGTGVEVEIDEQTQYPFDGRVQMSVAPASAVQFPLYLRIPSWCTGAKVELNGKALDVQPKAGAFVMIDRTWNKGDQVTVNLPMDVTVTTWEKNKKGVSVNRGPLTYSLKIGEKYVPWETERFKAPWPALEIIPTTEWNYGLSFDPAKLADAFTAVSKPWPASNMPFTLEGAPVEIKAKARKIANWKEDHLGLVDKLQDSPVKSDAPTEDVTLVPMGAARLRLTAFPVIGDGPDAHEWKLPAPAPTPPAK